MSGPGHSSSRRRGARRSSIYARAIEALELRRLLNAHIVGGSGTNNYALIQDAIDACPANGTVLVDPGTYTEQLFLYNGITLKGAQAGVDARSNARGVAAGASESILQGTLNGDGTRTFVVKFVGNNSTLDGFVIQNQTSTSTATGAAVVISPTISGSHIVNNIILNNVTGIYLANNSASAPALIQHNVIRDNNQPGAEQGFGIYTDGSLTGGVLTNVQIDGNFFYDNLGPSNFLVQPAVAFLAGTTSTQTNLQVTNNVFDTNGKAVLAANTSNLTITGNVVGNQWDVTSAALRFEGGDTNVTIQNNNLYGDGARAIYIDKKASAADNTTFTITNNNIYQNGTEVGGEFTGLKTSSNAYVGTLVATGNWWGSSTGPGGDYGGSGDNIWGGGASISYMPYATSPVVERQVPWYGVASAVGAPIQSEDFDHGLEGISYHDTTVSGYGTGGTYRPHNDVEIATTTDGGSGYVVTPVASEWLEYTINIPSAGTYQLDAHVQFSSNGGQFHLTKSDGTTTIPGSNVTLSGASGSFQTITQTGLTFDTSGVQVIRLVFDSGTLGQWNWIKLTQTGVSRPNAPSNLQATIVNAGQINLTWQDNSSNEANFILERSTDNTNWSPLATPAANATSYPDTTNLVVGTTYYYRIRATLGGGNDSANATTSIALTTPTTPAGLTASAASSSQINLTWTDTSNNESNFILERSTNNSTWSQISTPAANAISYNDNTGLSAKTHYYYRIRATNVVGPSGNSNVAAATTLAANGLPSPFVNADIGAPPTAGSATNTLGTFTVNGAGDFWNAADKGNFTYVPVTGDATIVAKVTSLSGNAGGYVGVMMRESLAANSSEFLLVIGSGSSIGNIRRTATAASATVPSGNQTGPALPIYLKINRVVSTNTFSASWGTDGVNFPNTFASVTFTMASSCYIGLMAANSVTAGTGTVGTGTLANVVITSAPTAPTGLGATAISASEIDLNWTDNAVNETGVKIERSLNGSTGWTQIGVADPDMTTYPDTTVSGSTQYFYRIRATNSTADSAYTTNATATTPAWGSMSGSTLNVTFDGTSTPITLAYGGGAGIVTAQKGAGTPMTFSGVVSIAAAGTANADALQLGGALATPLTFTNGNGADSIRLMTGGSYTFTSDLSPSLKNISLQIDSGGSATFNATQHLASLTVNGSATVAAGGNKVLVVQALAVTGQLDLKDNDLIFDNGTTSPVGTWNGSVYDGITGMVASGRNGGAWNGNGIRTSSATGVLTGLGVAQASQIFGSGLGVFDGETVDGAAVLVKFTYVGDVNLDGKINIDDYTRMDQSFPNNLQNWFNGDLNFDGKINIDDYTLADGNYPNQGGIVL